MRNNALLKGAYDIHVHVAPDVVPRACTLDEIANAALKAGMAGILLKDHCTSTVGRAAALNRMFSGGCRFFSALCLNPPVGSLNPVAVEAALKAGVDVIFFPTYGAANHIKIWGAGKPPTAFPLPENFKGDYILDQKGRLIPECLEIIKLIAQYNAVLATGHLSPDESLKLLAQAKKAGIKNMVVTHASEPVTPFNLAQQQETVSLGAFVEHSFFAITKSCPNSTSLENIAYQIKALGPEHVILSSDFGQVSNPPPVEGFYYFLAKIKELGFSEAEIRKMTCTNPERLLSGRKL